MLSIFEFGNYQKERLSFKHTYHFKDTKQLNVGRDPTMNGQQFNNIHIATSTPRDTVSCLNQMRKRLNLSQVISLRYSKIALLEKFSLHE